jgi:hypothetical protein
MATVEGRRGIFWAKRRLRVHNVLQTANTYTVSLAVILSVAMACRKTAGEGQKCGLGVQCADGLVCAEGTGTCLNLPEGLPPTSCDGPLLTDACAPYESTLYCPSLSVAEKTATGGCRVSGDGGTPMVCCPACAQLSWGCGDSGANYDCYDPHTPSERFPTLKCVPNFHWSAPERESTYCCASMDTCFPTDEFPPSCGDAGRSYACTGTTIPSDIGLRCEPTVNAGATGRYCCEDGFRADGGGAGDGE